MPDQPTIDELMRAPATQGALDVLGPPPQPVEIEHRRAHKFVKRSGRGCGHVLDSGKACGGAKTSPLHHGCPPSLNLQGSGGNQFVYQNAKKAWMAVFTDLLVGADLPKGLGGVLVEGVACFPDRIRRDQGNFRYLVEKSFGDTLVAGGWIDDDDWDRYEFGRLAKTYAKGEAWIRLQVFPGVVGGL